MTSKFQYGLLFLAINVLTILEYVAKVPFLVGGSLYASKLWNQRTCYLSINRPLYLSCPSFVKHIVVDNSLDRTSEQFPEARNIDRKKERVLAYPQSNNGHKSVK